MKAKNIGIDAPAPPASCEDKKCPFHGDLKIKKRTFMGKVISSRAQKSVIVEWERKHTLLKYERYEKRRTRLHAHNPSCIDAKEGDIVRIIETRPLSKTKNFVVVQKLGKEIKIKPEESAREKEKEKSRKKLENKKKKLEE